MKSENPSFSVSLVVGKAFDFCDKDFVLRVADVGVFVALS